MRRSSKLLAALALGSCLSSPVIAATITGSVTGPDGKPQMGVFVVAQDARTKRTVSVLSNEQGRYHIGNLPAATYNVQIKGIGFKADARRDVAVTADQKASFDFALQKRPVEWGELTTYQGRKLLRCISTGNGTLSKQLFLNFRRVQGLGAFLLQPIDDCRRCPSRRQQSEPTGCLKSFERRCFCNGGHIG